MNGLPLSIWYDWQDDGPDPTQLEQNFGLLTYIGQSKMASVAAQTLTHELGNLLDLTGSPQYLAVRPE